MHFVCPHVLSLNSGKVDLTSYHFGINENKYKLSSGIDAIDLDHSPAIICLAPTFEIKSEDRIVTALYKMLCNICLGFLF